MAFALTYQDYASSHPGDASGGSEGGQGTSSLMPEDQWNSLSDAQKWNQVGNGILLTPSDPRYADLAQELGVTNGRQIIGGPMSQSIALNSTNLVDPTKVAKQGDNFFTSDENLTPLAQKTDTSSNWFHEMGPGLLIVGTILSAGALAGAAGLAGGAAEGAAGVSGSSALATGGFGTDIAAGSGTFGAAGAASGVAGGSGSAGGAGLADDPASAAQGGAYGTPPSAPTPDPTLPPGTQAPAPVSETAPPVGTQAPAGVTDASVPAQNGGFINGAANAGTSTSNSLMPQWYNNLSPGARQILGTAVSTAGRAAITGIAQQHAIDAQQAIINQHRQDVIRQGQVPLLPPNTFVAKPGGLINNASNGGASGP